MFQIMTKDTSFIEDARRAALSGDYQDALQIIEFYLNLHPQDLDAIILKGNTLELNAYANSDAEDLSFENCDYLYGAKTCYELALQINKKDIRALLDLANLNKAAKKYNECHNLLEQAFDVMRSNKEDGEDLENLRMEILEINSYREKILRQPESKDNNLDLNLPKT